MKTMLKLMGSAVEPHLDQALHFAMDNIKDDFCEAALLMVSNPHLRVNELDSKDRSIMEKVVRMNLKKKKTKIGLVDMLLKREETGGDPVDVKGLLHLALDNASTSGGKKVIDRLFECERINFNESDKQGQTALEKAIRMNKSEVVKKLLERKDIVVKEKQLLLALDLKAAKEVLDHLVDCKMNFKAKDKQGETALMKAIKLRKSGVVGKLVGKKDVAEFIKDMLHFALDHGANEKVIEQLLKCGKLDVNERDGIGQTALAKAIHMKKALVVQMLLERSEVELKGMLHLALDSFKDSKADQEILDLLLRRPDLNLDEVDRYRLTALQKAVELKRTDIAQRLLVDRRDVGADGVLIQSLDAKAPKELVNLVLSTRPNELAATLVKASGAQIEYLLNVTQSDQLFASVVETPDDEHHSRAMEVLLQNLSAHQMPNNALSAECHKNCREKIKMRVQNALRDLK